MHACFSDVACWTCIITFIGLNRQRYLVVDTVCVLRWRDLLKSLVFPLSDFFQVTFGNHLVKTDNTGVFNPNMRPKYGSISNCRPLKNSGLYRSCTQKKHLVRGRELVPRWIFWRIHLQTICHLCRPISCWLSSLAVEYYSLWTIISYVAWYISSRRYSTKADDTHLTGMVFI
jgi:hypothetical protein